MSVDMSGVVTWLKGWFYDKDDVDNIIANLPSGGGGGSGISSITLVPYSENPDGVICYNSSSTPTPTPVQVVDRVTLSSDVSILSAYDSDTATLSVTVLDEDNQAIPNVSVEFFKGSDSLGTSTTNNNGVATKTYSATGDGDITFSASCTGVSSESISIEDCIKYNHLDINGWSTNNNPTVSTSDEGITISTSSSGEKRVYFAQAFTSSDNVEMSFVWVGGVSNAQCMACAFLRTDNIDSEKFFSRSCPSQFAYKFKSSGSTSYSQESLATGDTIKLQYVNGVCKAYKNDTLIGSATTSIYNFYFGFYTNSGRSQTIKDIKIKPL